VTYDSDARNGENTNEKTSLRRFGSGARCELPLRGFTSALKGVGDVPARGLDGGETVLSGSPSRPSLPPARDVLLAGSQDYDRMRRVWNASFDKKPALIVRCTGPPMCSRRWLLHASTSC